MTKKERIYNKEASLFNKWENQSAIYTKESNQTVLTPYTKINSRQIKDPNVRPQAIKLLEENICSMLFVINLTKKILELSPQAKEIKARIKK